MRTFDPYGLPESVLRSRRVIDIEARCEAGPTRSRRECARLEWRAAEGGDPIALLCDFLAGYGLGLPGPASSVTHGDRVDALILLSAAAGAVTIGVSAGRPSPAPAIPDLVCVIYAPAAAGPPEHAGEPGNWRLGEWRPSWTPAEHAAAVREVREAIARGDVYQVNLVGHASAPYRGDPLPALRRVTRLPGAAYPYLVAGDGWVVACASPETLLRVQAGTVQTLPIKGTRPATAAGRSELLASAKERAEHVMIVDLERNDLARVARTGSVTVPSLFAVRRWCRPRRTAAGHAAGRLGDRGTEACRAGADRRPRAGWSRPEHGCDRMARPGHA
jgi:para-aminobenzoate synthetase component I